MSPSLGPTRKWRLPMITDTFAITALPVNYPDRSLQVPGMFKVLPVQSDSGLQTPIVKLMYPDVLVLSKLKAWYSAKTSSDPTQRTRAKAHPMDIMAGLRWLSSKRETMEVCRKVPKEVADRSFFIPRELYRDHKDTQQLRLEFSRLVT